jgi:FixJ family two-component response regulator
MSKEFAMASPILVSVVDDDESIRESLPGLLRQFGFDAKAFSSAEDFLISGDVKRTGCLILDISMPGMSGPELQQELTRRGEVVPIVFITATVDDATPAKMLQLGAAACLFKPFSNAGLLDAVRGALRPS